MNKRCLPESRWQLFSGQKRRADGEIHATRDCKMSEVHCKTLKRVCRAIQKKRHGMLTYGVVLLNDNVCLHMGTAACTRALLEYFNWELYDHPPYSSDLTPSNYDPFTYLKK
jgi:hypothetical protein